MGPTSKSSSDNSGSVKLSKLNKCTILVVDDEPLILRSVTRVLSREGYDIRTTESPREALSIYKGGGIDLLITDRQMPEMNGIDLLRLIRNHDVNAKVLVLTGGIGDRERSEFITSGATAVMDKPVDSDVLRNTVSSALSKKKGNLFSEKPPKNEEMRKNESVNILVVDDDEDIRLALSELLNAVGYESTTAGNGLDAVQRFISGKFDLIISDYHMPHMDGLEMLCEMKKIKPETKVIMVFAEKEPGETEKVLAAGAFAVLKKPLEIGELQIAITNALSSS